MSCFWESRLRDRPVKLPMGASLCGMWQLVDNYHLSKEVLRITTPKKRQKSSLEAVSKPFV